jgi:hypothetical protein
VTGSWWSQPFAPEGSAAAEGIVKQLGQPALDPLTVLVREAAQNSWDARDGSGPVEFRVSVQTLGHRAEAWRRRLLPQPGDGSGVELSRALMPDSVLLVISDRRTVGLGGPLRAGQRAARGENADFVQFLRNVGEPSDHKFGGGTYGFGKGIFYRLSGASTILVSTLTREDGPTRRRLMGAALGHSWYDGEQRYTGRHWWGNIASDDIPDPILSSAADAVASELGLPNFDDGRSGTDIVVIGADLGVTGDEPHARPRTAEEAATFLSSSILWHLWPKFVPDADGQYMEFAVSVEGADLRLPSPEDLAEFQPFVESLRSVRAGEGAAFTRSLAPRNAGRFSMTVAGANTGATRLLVAAARPFEGPTSHIARMRVAELVVDYLAGPPHPDAVFRYGGVFKASEDADGVFAAAEPPTHDDWVDKGLTGTVRGVVQGARRFVLRQIEEKLGLGGPVGGGGGQGLGELSARLSSLVPTVAATGASPVAPTSNGSRSPGSGVGGISGGGGRAAGRVGGHARLVGSPALQLHDGTPFLVALVHVPAADRSRRVRAEVLVVVEGGGRETEPPAGALMPAVTQWQPVGGGPAVHSATLDLPAGEASDWWVYATHVPDAVVRFRVTQETAHAV